MDDLLTGLPVSTLAPGGLLFGLAMVILRTMYTERKAARGLLHDETTRLRAEIDRKDAEIDRLRGRISALEDQLDAERARRREAESR